jgi:hypothetical protein
VKRFFAAIALPLSGLAISASSMSAQTSGLSPRLSTDTRVAIERIIDSVRANDLPTAPLVDKVAEGVLKGADEPRILIAVRNLARELNEAKEIVGSTADPALLGATASALHAGATAANLRQLAHPSAGSTPDSHSVAVGFVALADLVTKRISIGAARQAVGELLKRRASDADFATLRSEVDQDIRDGVAPDVALSNRVRTRVEVLDARPFDGIPVRRSPPM